MTNLNSGSFDPDDLELVRRGSRSTPSMFRLGDPVRLNSGGPVMIVVRLPDPDPVAGDVMVGCQWPTEEMGYQERSFPSQCLERV